MSPRRLCVLIAALLATATPGAQNASLQARMRAAEDARVATEQGVAPLLQGLRSADPALVLLAVRGLGRFEQPAFVARLLPFLTHDRTDVRREAANALGQSLAGLPRNETDAPAPRELPLVARALLTRIGAEQDPNVRGIIAETVGRLPYRTADAVQQVERALRLLLPPPDGDKPALLLGAAGHTAVLTGAIRGLESLIRLNRARMEPDALTMARVRAAATRVADPSDADFAYIRRVAWAAIVASETADAAIVARGVDDSDAQVRRLAMTALAKVSTTDERRRTILTKALADPSPRVRYEAVRTYAQTLRASDCAPGLRALDDADDHVVLAAIDALGESCSRKVDVIAALVRIADALPAANGPNADVAWHRAAHALVSLAHIRREAATPRLARFAEYPVWQVRMYAARAATTLSAVARLERLAADPVDNVRTQAIAGLKQVSGHEADSLFIDALERHDYQLLLTAARALEGTPNPKRAAGALLAAFARVTTERSETSRDTRMAILDRLAEVGSSQDAAALRACLADFDPVVAGACARLIERWTGTAPTIQAERMTDAPILEVLPTRARIVMRGGGQFELRLLPHEAPVTVSRFARLARQGYYNGLQFHRVVPDFVIQGGGPGANEYSGAPRFMRDEVGLTSHLRGSVGVSTRGRDTGDGQIFIDLVDNPRLDHEYTVFAQVTAGMDVVDGVLEGDVIERVDIM